MLNIKKKLHTNLLNIFKKNILSNYRIIIELKPNSQNLIKKLQNHKQCKIIYILMDINILCIIISHKLLSKLIESPETSYICFDSELYLCGNKLFIETEKPYVKPTSYTTNFTGKNIRVAIIDSGIYPLDIFTKPKNRIALFRDFINDLSHPYDDNGHGTCICNIIGGNFIYKNSYLKNANECEFCVIKAFDKYNKSYCSIIFKALDTLYHSISELNIQILCLPFELLEFNNFIISIFQNLINKFIKYNVLIVLPIGNNSSDYCSLKGLSLLNNCIIVGGINYKETSYGISNKKMLKPHIVSIYDNIYSPNIDTKYISEKNNHYIYPPRIKNSLIEYFGTSLSCAYICSVLALLKQKNIYTNINDTLSLLKISCSKEENIYPHIQGLGIINLNQLLK